MRRPWLVIHKGDVRCYNSITVGRGTVVSQYYCMSVRWVYLGERGSEAHLNLVRPCSDDGLRVGRIEHLLQDAVLLL